MRLLFWDIWFDIVVYFLNNVIDGNSIQNVHFQYSCKYSIQGTNIRWLIIDRW